MQRLVRSQIARERDREQILEKLPMRDEAAAEPLRGGIEGRANRDVVAVRQGILQCLLSRGVVTESLGEIGAQVGLGQHGLELDLCLLAQQVYRNVVVERDRLRVVTLR